MAVKYKLSNNDWLCDDSGYQERCLIRNRVQTIVGRPLIRRATETRPALSTEKPTFIQKQMGHAIPREYRLVIKRLPKF